MLVALGQLQHAAQLLRLNISANVPRATTTHPLINEFE